MFKVTEPQLMNETFARAFNSRRIENMLSLYEPEAILLVDGSGCDLVGLQAIAEEFTRLLAAPGTMVSLNNFCVCRGDIALLRADFALRDGERVIASGSTAEVIRRQNDGSWLYLIDHTVGASLPSVT